MAVRKFIILSTGHRVRRNVPTRVQLYFWLGHGRDGGRLSVSWLHKNREKPGNNRLIKIFWIIKFILTKRYFLDFFWSFSSCLLTRLPMDVFWKIFPDLQSMKDVAWIMLHDSYWFRDNFTCYYISENELNLIHRSRGLTAIPRAFPQDATVIDMSHNQIKALGEIPPLEGNG